MMGGWGNGYWSETLFPNSYGPSSLVSAHPSIDKIEGWGTLCGGPLRFQKLRVCHPPLAKMRHDIWKDVYAYNMKAFVDDSGSGGDSRWFVLAGYLGTADAWDKFDAPWRAVLDGPPKIEYFKSSQAERLNRFEQWKGITPDQRDGRINALIEVIGRHATRPINVRLKQQDYDEVIKPWVPPQWESPYYALFLGFIQAAASTEKYLNSAEQIEFIFDNNEQVHEPSLRLYKQVADLPYLRGKIKDVRYEDEKVFLPLQAADLVAWQIRRRLCVKEPPRAQLESALSCTPLEAFEHVITRKRLHGIGRAMDDNAKATWARMGYSESIRQWKRPKSSNW